MSAARVAELQAAFRVLAPALRGTDEWRLFLKHFRQQLREAKERRHPPAIIGPIKMRDIK